MRIGLVDCNNFYVSCELLFRPQWKGRPIVVLSNNDGCVVARSKEAKALGIPMGAPAFKYRALFETQNVVTLSSNYPLYGDISHRVMQVVAAYTSECQVYSIDEAFFRVEREGDPEKMRAQMLQWLGIPISIGVASTKTLAKVASELAKSEPSGIFYVTEANLKATLESLPVEEVWGIGKNWVSKLQAKGIFTALQLSLQEDSWLRHHLTVVGQRLVWELRGIPCLELNEVAEKKKSILCSRSFSPVLTTYEDLAEKIACFVASAARRLREQKSLAGAMQVFIETSPYSETPFYANSLQFTFPEATDYTPDLITSAKSALKALYRSGYLYKRAGILLFGLIDKGAYQQDLFDPLPLSPKRQKLVDLVDHLNQRAGKNLLRFAAEGSFAKCPSARFTSAWDELLTIQLDSKT